MLIEKVIYHLNANIKKCWYKICYGKKVKFGKHVTFRKGFTLVIEDGGKIEIGDNVFFNNYCSIVAKGNIKIGSGTIFGENVKIYDHNHRFADFDKPIKEQGYSVGEVVVGSHCWICSNVLLLKGANVGNNSIIGGGCIVNATISSNKVVRIEQGYTITEIKRRE